MLFNAIPLRMRHWRPTTAQRWGGGLALAAAIAVAAIGPARLIAQIEGERGIAPVASTGDIEVDGIQVNTTGKTAEEARRNGWREATRQAWAKAGGPQLSDGQLEGLVSSVVIQQEQIGPRRYIATLGVIFDRTRASQFVSGGSALGTRSQPLLMLPLLYSGGVAQIYEVRTPWQAAWARFHAGASAIDYVRPTGGGGDSLLLTAGQVTRRSRTWWRNVLDQFGASDVIVPVARLERQWPGGPVKGTFTARYGPDNRPLGTFVLTAPGPEKVPAMLDEAVRRMDRIYTDALVAGTLRVNPTLNSERLALDPAIAALLAAANRVTAAQEQAVLSEGGEDVPAPTIVAAPAADAPVVFTVQFASPDARAVDAALATVRGLSGVRAAATTSLAMGGTSVMRVTYGGSLDELAAALRARGYAVTIGNGALSIRR
ncbi:heavy-metal-associated domain-containing protein [Novosphingobium sp.]|uniref:heavy-metal-associated domain-containing protein n=1 Tax=Novosphingobium sp. TaxID=1874826 RepID=UPI002601AA7B|nr:heavy-metal-associated domain-containing protein [Novosphingobium sp.]